MALNTYRIERFFTGQAEYNSWTKVWSDNRIWYVKIEFEHPVDETLFMLIKSCLPTRTREVKGRKIGFMRYEWSEQTHPYGDVYMLTPTTVQAQFQDTRASHDDSSGSRTFLVNLGIQLVKLVTCACGQTATVTQV